VAICSFRADNFEFGGDLSFPKIFLTGVPGCGKTTVIKQIAERFGPWATGFYTEEVRDAGGERIGFDLVDLHGGRAVFARQGEESSHRVGTYSVFLTALEGWGLDRLRPPETLHPAPLVILDEVGKMECLSSAFRREVLRLLEEPRAVLGVVARQGGSFIRQVREHPSVECIEVTAANRDQLGPLLCMRLAPLFTQANLCGKLSDTCDNRHPGRAGPRQPGAIAGSGDQRGSR
jgi:nucleoside-triphosphatase